MNALLGRKPSYFWKGLVWGRELLSMGLRYRVGDDSTIYFFIDNWIPRNPSLKLISPNIDNFDLTAADFILPNKTWDLPKLNIPLMFMLLRVFLSTLFLLKTLIWHYSPNGCYDVKSGYILGFNHKNNESSSNSSSINFYWNSLWNLNIHNKIKIFIWRALNNRLPTKDNLAKRGLNSLTCCPICFCPLETITHTLLFCPRAKDIWKSLLPDAVSTSAINGSFFDCW